MTARRPRAAVFSTNFLEYSQTFVYDELRHHERWDVAVCCHRRCNPDRFAWPDVFAVSEQPGLRGPVEGLLYKTIAQSPGALAWLARGKFDLFHAHFGPGSVYALAPAQLFDMPLVVTYHGYDVPVLASPDRWRPRFLRYFAASRFMFARVDRFLAASDELARMLVELGAPPERVHVWRLGIEIPPTWRFREPDGAFRIAMIGRFVEKKGFEYGLRAFARIAPRFPKAEVVMVGDGERRSEYERILDEHGLRERVRFAGVMPHDRVFELIEASDLLVAPSVVGPAGDRESGILVVKEANARGVPAIGTLHGGIPEIIDDGETGYLVPERDVDALADRLTRLCDDEALRRRLGAAARAKMEAEYDIRQRVAALEEHYDAAVAEHRQRKKAR